MKLNKDYWFEVKIIYTVIKEEMYMKYRLLVKVGRSWKHGRVVYDSYLEAQIRQEELRLVGIKSRITDELGGEL